MKGQFGTRLKRLRLMEGLTQQELAEAADVTVEYVSKLERGLASPSFDVLARLCSALRTQPANLFLFTVVHEPHQPASNPARGRAEDPVDAQDTIGLDGFISGMAFWTRDIATDTCRFSMSMRRLLGCQRCELPTDMDGLLQYFMPEDRPRMARAKALHDQGIQTPPQRIGLRRKDGSVRQCILLAEVLVDDKGTPAMAHGSMLDVTELMELDRHLGRTHEILEERVRERTEHLHATIRSLGGEIALRKRIIDELAIYRHMVESSTDRMAFLDLERRFRVVNRAVADHYRLPAGEMVGMSVEDVAGLSTISVRSLELIELALAGEPVRFQAWQRLPGREPAYQDVSLSPCPNSDGDLMGVVSLVRDITDHERAKQAAEEANRAKSEFLASMSHDLRTPLSGVLGMLQLLERSSLDETQRDCVDTALASGRSLLAIMNDILDLSRVESGRLEIRLAPVSPRDLAQEIVGTMASQAEAKGLDLEQHVDQAVPPAVLSDAVRLRQILANLLDNAIKFTDQGRVRLDVGVAGHKDQPRLKLTVTDTGKGIAEDQLRQVFEPFMRGKGHASDLPGTGLGLAIVQRLARLMGGEASISGAQGRGTAVTVTVAAPPADTPGVGAQNADGQPRTGRPLRLLVVDNDPVSRSLMRRLLTLGGHKATCVGSGTAALETLRDRHFDGVFLDVEMPGMDGLELARRIRAGEFGDHARTPLAALTAHALAGDRERFLAAHMDHYLPKPVDMSDLEDVLAAMADAAP